MQGLQAGSNGGIHSNGVGARRQQLNSLISRRALFRNLSGLLGAPAFLKARPKYPNILFVMTDEHRADSLACYGHPLVKTPNFDRLAAEGVRFENFFTASPVCSPARVSAFTGRYPKTHQVQRNAQKMRAGEILLPALLKKYGYITGLAGKLHFHSQDRVGLFDFDQEAPGPQYTAYLKRQGLPTNVSQPAVVDNDPPLGLPESPWLIGTSMIPEEHFITSWIADRALEFLQQQDGQHPWFLFLSFWKPHSPFVIPAPYSTMYSPDEVPMPELPVEKPFPPTADNRTRHYVLASQEHILRRLRAHYYGAITYVDAQLGRVVEWLRSKGWLERTIIVFTSDHGNSLGELGRMFKGTPYEGAIRVPCIWRFPEGLPQGKVVSHLADTTCIMPTLLELAGIPEPVEFESISAVSLMRGEPVRWENIVFTEFFFHAVRTPRYKLVKPFEHPTWVWQLFDLKVDPTEKTNFFGRPEYADVQAMLLRRLGLWEQHRPSDERRISA